MDSKTLALKCRELADNKKAENIVILDVKQLSSVTDYYVIATGSSEPHLRAIVEETSHALQTELGLRPRSRDGAMSDSWIVLDYFDVIVHIMKGDARERYDLEGLWRDAPRILPGSDESRVGGMKSGRTCASRATKTATSTGPKSRANAPRRASRVAAKRGED